MNRPFFHPPRIQSELVILPTDEYYRQRYRKSRGGSWLLLLVTVIAVLVTAVSARAEDVPASAEAGEFEGVGINDSGSGDLLFRGAEAGRYIPAVHLATRVNIDVRGLSAEVHLQQAFRNTSNDWREAVYVLPLPENAAVNAMEIVVGERRIVGKVRERAEAQKVYREARAAGKRAALLEQQRPNLFTSRVANIAPGETISVEVRYLQTLRFDSGQFSLRLPGTLTPRYIPGNPVAEVAETREVSLNSHGWALPSDQVPDADRISPVMMPMNELTQLGGEEGGKGSHQMQIEINLGMGLPLADIYSPYHEVSFRRDGEGRYRVQLKSGSAAMDRDFALYWRPQSSAMPSAALFAEKSAQAEYLQLLLLPPDGSAQQRRLPREVVYVMDTSGSMSGASIRQAKESLLLALTRLGPQDRFNIIEFNSNYRTFFPRPVPSTRDNIQRARDWVESLQATGGTEMAPALTEALSQQVDEEAGELVRQVIFITDGAVGNERALFEIIRQRLGHVRLFTVGIGAAPNSHFMHKAAEYGRGASVQIGDLNEVQTRMQALFAKLENPLVTDLSVRWPAGVKVEAYPKRLPDLYAGEPVQLVAQLDAGALGRAGSGEVVIHGRLAGKRFSRTLSLAALTLAENNKTIGSLWARAKIANLHDQQRALDTGPASDEVRTALRGEIVGLALAYQLASPYTSFVAVEEAPVRPQSESLKSSPVPNAVARGQVQQPFTYPATATGVYGQLLLAALLLVVGGWLRVGYRSPHAFSGALGSSLRRWLRRVMPDVRR